MSCSRRRTRSTRSHRIRTMVMICFRCRWMKINAQSQRALHLFDSIRVPHLLQQLSSLKEQYHAFHCKTIFKLSVMAETSRILRSFRQQNSAHGCSLAKPGGCKDDFSVRRIRATLERLIRSQRSARGSLYLPLLNFYADIVLCSSRTETVL